MMPLPTLANFNAPPATVLNAPLSECRLDLGRGPVLGYPVTCLKPNFWWFRQPGLRPDNREIQFFTPEPRALTFTPPEQPLRVVFLTSLRDVARIERVGRQVCVDGRSDYMQGTLEYALRQIQPGGELHRYLDVVGVVVDDCERDLFGSDVPLLPSAHCPWIHPLHLRNCSGEAAEDFTHNIPSAFRELPRDDEKGRARAKIAFEGRIADLLQRVGAHLLIVDHYMAQIDYLIDPAVFGLYGRVLNTHPGITRVDSPWTCTGRDSELRALEHANGLHWDAESDSYIQFPVHGVTGASFHLVSAGIDQGLVLCDSENTPVDRDDHPMTVVRRNYRCSKNPVFSWGIRHYASHIFPQLEEALKVVPGGSYE